MGTTLQKELASLRIERPESAYPTRARSSKPSPARRRGGGGLRLLSLLLWLIPLGLLAAAGTVAYKQYNQMRSRPEVTRGLVQRMTPGEASKLLSGHRVPQVALAGDDRHEDHRAGSSECMSTRG